jgi:hypothetical protein
LEERLLKEVLRARARAGQPPAVGQELPAIAVHQRFEGALVPVVGQLDQPMVGLGLKKA